MGHEESEPSFHAELEACLFHGPVDDVVELLHSSGESAYVLSGVGLDQAMSNFEASPESWSVVSAVTMIERPEVLARCMYEFERRNADRAKALMLDVEEELRSLKKQDRFRTMLPFLDRLRENGEGGSDGGAGDREPRTPHDPRDVDSIAVDPPEYGDVSAVGVLDRPADDEAA
jgi:hypothetical protein